jgi:hypothetical protein
MPSSVTDSLKVYDILKAAQISEPHARAITQAIRESESAIALDVRSVLDERLQHLATKADLADFRTELRTEIGNVRTELKADIESATAESRAFRAEAKIDTANLRTELKTDMAELKAELMRWTLMLWIGQMAAMVGIVFAAFKLWR